MTIVSLTELKSERDSALAKLQRAEVLEQVARSARDCVLEEYSQTFWLNDAERTKLKLSRAQGATLTVKRLTDDNATTAAIYDLYAEDLREAESRTIKARKSYDEAEVRFQRARRALRRTPESLRAKA